MVFISGGNDLIFTVTVNITYGNAGTGYGICRSTIALFCADRRPVNGKIADPCGAAFAVADGKIGYAGCVARFINIFIGNITRVGERDQIVNAVAVYISAGKGHTKLIFYLPGCPYFVFRVFRM